MFKLKVISNSDNSSRLKIGQSLLNYLATSNKHKNREHRKVCKNKAYKEEPVHLMKQQSLYSILIMCY